VRLRPEDRAFVVTVIAALLVLAALILILARTFLGMW